MFKLLSDMAIGCAFSMVCLSLIQFFSVFHLILEASPTTAFTALSFVRIENQPTGVRAKFNSCAQIIT